MTLNGLPPVPIDISSCWPSLKQQSQMAAEQINATIQNSSNPGIAELRQRFEKVMADTKKAGQCPFVPGNGPLIEESNKIAQLALDMSPTITPDEEQAILQATLPIPEPDPSFLRRNAVPLFVGGGVLVLGVVGMILLIKI